MQGTGYFAGLLFGAAALLGSCGGSNSNLSFRLVRHVPIDEQEHTLRYAPLHITALSPNRIAFEVASGVSIYNTHTGQPVRRFAPDAALDRQLLERCRATDSARGIAYQPTVTRNELQGIESDGLFSPGSRIEGYYYAANRFYLLYAVRVSYAYRTEAQLLAAMGADSGDAARQLRTALEQPGVGADIFVQQGYRQFLLETDSLFRLLHTCWVDETALPRSRWGDYSLNLNKGFVVHNNTLYCNAHNQASIYRLPDTMLLVDRDSLPLLVALELGETVRWKGEVLRTCDIPNFRTTALEHNRRMWCFREHNGTLFSQTHVGWFAVPGGQRCAQQPVYATTEQPFGDFDVLEAGFIYGTARQNTPLDSAFRLRVMATGQTTPVFDTLMPGGCFFDVAASNYFFINPKEGRYFIDVYERNGG